MNNNRGNNRRRGRGNNRPQGGGQQLNRIDSRARGNAPQLLEKYRKLAHDAHLNGDRVNAEYYLQFADHYFRVIADTRLRQEEQRLRRDERWQEGGEPYREDGEDSGDFSVESDFPAFDQPVYQRREREDRDGNRETRDNNRDNQRDGREQGNREGREGRDNNRDREWRNNRRDERPAREEPAAEPEATGEEPSDANPYEPPENPFLRPNRAARGLRPRRDDRAPREDQPREEQSRDDQPREGQARREDRRPRRDSRPERTEAPEPAPGIDLAALPPAIGREPSADADDAPAPRKRAVRRKPAAGDADGPLQSVD